MGAAIHAPAHGRGPPYRNQVGERWFVDETYLKVNGIWRYVYRAVDQHGQVIDVFVSRRRDIASARRFFTTSLTAHGEPTDVTRDRVPALATVIDELMRAPACWGELAASHSK